MCVFFWGDNHACACLVGRIMNEAVAYGVNIEAAPSGPAWRAVLVRHLTPEQNKSGQNVFITVADEEGYLYAQPVRAKFRAGWKWDGGPDLSVPLDKPVGPMEKGHGNVVLSKGAVVSVWMIADGLPSDRVTGLHTNHADERGPNGEIWNSIGHHSFYVMFQKSTTVQLPRTAYITATSGLNLRERPTTGAKVLRTIAYAEQVTITGAPVGEWLPATYQGQAGYLFTQYVDTSKPTTDGVVDNFARALGWVLKEEAGYTPGIPGDPGGETNRGITKRSYPHLDIKNLTMQQTVDIYLNDYWKPSGANALPWPSCLAVFDGAVQHGVGTARSLWSQSNGNRLRYMGLRLQFYGAIPNVSTFEKPWGNRMGRLLLEVSK